MQLLLSVGQNDQSDLSRFRISEDLPLAVQIVVLALSLASLVLLLIEVRAQRQKRWLILGSGLIATVCLTLSILRPVHLQQKGRKVPGVVLALLDSSHRLQLPIKGDRTRWDVSQGVADRLAESLSDTNLIKKRFGRGLLSGGENERADTQSDFLSALAHAQALESERPRAIVLVSDGRLTRPGPYSKEGWEEALMSAAAGAPIHTVLVAKDTPRDRSLRRVGLSGSAVAHQPFRLEVEVGCEPALTCDEVEVVVRELLEGQAPLELTRGRAKGDGGKANLSLEVTLDRAGSRVLEVELLSEGADEVPENDRRLFPVQVRRDRLRMLHVAGRPTYDVRALRMFLKSDESIDLVSFFILRTESDQVSASQDELALIPFPVDELFSEHLSSFDAVILQDIHAVRYRLNPYFRAIKDYVFKGGGLILVGGPTGFSSGGYAGSPVAEVLPVELPTDGELIVRKAFYPRYTDVGRVAPVLKALRSTMGEGLVEMSGANALGRPRPGALVLWEHPELSEHGQSGGAPMPVLALGEVGDGRSIAISVDSTHQLRFGEAGAKTGGRAYADLWEGLLGWLMRDPRYESAQLRSQGDCIAKRDQILLVDPLVGVGDDVSVKLERLGTAAFDALTLQRLDPATDGSLRYVARELPSGAYAARVQVGAAPPTRTVLACEAGGEAWADSRPDEQRMRRIAEATGGKFLLPHQVDEIPEPPSTFVSVYRESHAIMPAWVWVLLSVMTLSVHWIARRAVGHA